MLDHLAKLLGKDVRAHGAGSMPSGRINPFALNALRNAGVDNSGFRSKSWDEFTGTNSPAKQIIRRSRFIGDILIPRVLKAAMTASAELSN